MAIHISRKYITKYITKYIRKLNSKNWSLLNGKLLDRKELVEKVYSQSGPQCFSIGNHTFTTYANVCVQMHVWVSGDKKC